MGPYRIDTVIGRGGMGIVYKARHTERDEVRALKLISPNAAAREEARRRFIAEARSMACVRHPNVGEIYEIAESEGLLRASRGRRTRDPTHAGAVAGT